MSDLTGRVARAIMAAQLEQRDPNEAAIREVLAALRKPGSIIRGKMIGAAFKVRAADLEGFSSTRLFNATLDAFAREHDLS